MTIGPTLATIGGKQFSIPNLGSGGLTLVNGAGSDIINASAFTGKLTIDGGAGNDVLIGGTGADSLIGNVGNDWISGGAGNDILLGGSRRDILVGGTGVDRLNQSTDTSGADDDILIGGSTLYDTSTSAILAILSEWSNTSNSFTARVTKLKTTGITGGYKLTNASPLPTVSDDGVVDTLFGGAGQDWYFAKRPGETTDATSTDEIAQQVNL